MKNNFKEGGSRNGKNKYENRLGTGDKRAV